MVGVLIGMKLRVLAHSLNGTRAAGMVLGGLAGLLLAAGTIALTVAGPITPAVRADLLAAVLAVWLFGWLLGPVYTGGGDESLRPEHFSLLPLRPVRLAFGLLTAAFVGIAPVVSLIAFLALVGYAATLGPAAVAVALLAAPVQVVLVVVLSRVMIGGLALIVRSRLGAVLAALVNAAMTVLLNQSWVLIWAAVELDLFRYGFPERFSAVVRALPSAWGLAAIEAAGRGAWPVVAGLLAALGALIGAALLLWSRLLVARTTTRTLHRVPAAARRGWDRLADRGPAGAVAAKELNTWSRDLMRLHLFFFALFFGVLYTLVPLLIDWRGMLPWAGLIVVGMAAATSANLIGLDGTALWLSLVNPGVERAEVRGRQLAWLLQVGPLAIGLTVLGTALGGGAATWPWALGLLAAALGGGAGLVVLVSVYGLVPVTEPQRRSGNPLEAGAIFGQVLVVLLLVTVTTAPAALVAYVGDRSGLPLLSWAAVPVGLATGGWLAVAGGRAAYRRLRDTGPDLLATMRSGGTTTTAGRTAVTVGRRVPVKLSPGRQALVTFLWIFCWIPLFPQGLLPLWMIFSESGNKLWFLALHLPDPYRVPVAVAFVVTGLVMLYYGTVLPRRAGRVAEQG